MDVPKLPNLKGITAKQAVPIQRELAGQVRLEPLAKPPITVAGVDVTSEWRGHHLWAAAVTFDAETLIPIEETFAEGIAEFPYIPGFLSFREIPVVLAALAKLDRAPDVILVDGQGITHPRYLGIASHLGVLLGIPTIGVAKSRLYGVWAEPKEVGDESPIFDPKTREQLGVAMKTRRGAAPIIVSPGHMITIEESAAIVRSLLQGYRLPLTTRRAHEAVNLHRRTVGAFSGGGAAASSGGAPFSQTDPRS
jgi:deoxyribonuclease V